MTLEGIPWLYPLKQRGYELVAGEDGTKDIRITEKERERLEKHIEGRIMYLFKIIQQKNVIGKHYHVADSFTTFLK